MKKIIIAAISVIFIVLAVLLLNKRGQTDINSSLQAKQTIPKSFMTPDDLPYNLRESLNYTAIAGLHRGLMVCDCIYCELVVDNREESLYKMLDKRQIKFMSAMKTFPSVLRTEYCNGQFFHLRFPVLHSR